MFCLFFFFKQKTAYEMRISDWSSDVCSSDLARREPAVGAEALRLIEEEQHRGVMDRRGQQVGKFAHDMRADRLILVISGETDDALLVGRNREMIGPEMDEAFGEGGLRRDRGGQARARGLAIMEGERSKARGAGKGGVYGWSSGVSE